MAINLAVSSENKVSAWDMKAVRRIQDAARDKVIRLGDFLFYCTVLCIEREVNHMANIAVRLVTRERRLCPESFQGSNHSWNQVRS